jgi:hypothetical protein
MMNISNQHLDFIYSQVNLLIEYEKTKEKEKQDDFEHKNSNR